MSRSLSAVRAPSIVQACHSGFRNSLAAKQGARVLAGSFNYTWIDAHGQFTGNTCFTSPEVEVFISYVYNATLS